MIQLKYKSHNTQPASLNPQNVSSVESFSHVSFALPLEGSAAVFLTCQLCVKKKRSQRGLLVDMTESC